MFVPYRAMIFSSHAAQATVHQAAQPAWLLLADLVIPAGNGGTGRERWYQPGNRCLTVDR